ncbi:MAG TPA: RDD family protein, partial [Pseudolysinimonas sp.]|nr:RDD family protein [Pseudolysinimonas sp.]
PENRWPGERLGLPEAGPRSIARFGRRLAAIAIDWAVAYGLAWLFFRDAHGTVDGLIILAVFAVLTILFLLVLNGSLGQIILRMRVVPARGGYLGLWRPFVRTILLCLVIPAVVFDRDQRGLHDRAAGTILVRV